MTTRVLAIALLMAFLLPSAAPLLAGGSGSMRCPETASGMGNGTAASLVAGTDGAACQHTATGPCVSPLGCTTPGPAIRTADGALGIPASLIALGVPPAAPLDDLYRSGPPTPPPNLI